MAEEAKKAKKSNGKLIAIIVSAVVVVAAGVTLLLLWLLVWNGGIKTMEQLRTALKEKKAVNCVITSPEKTEVTLQTNDGFTKVKMFGEFQEGQGKMNVLMTDGMAYMWADGGALAFKTKSTQMLDSMIESIQNEDEGDTADTKGYKVKCEAASKADFKVPSDVNFMDADAWSDMGGNGYDGGDYDWDWE